MQLISLDQCDLIKNVTRFHGHHVNQLQNIIDQPEGIEITVITETGSLTLSGSEAKSFRYGVQFALAMLQNLPFPVALDGLPTETTP